MLPIAAYAQEVQEVEEQMDEMREEVPESVTRLTIDEVVVTSQKREQTLQEVPVSVSAITAGMMDATNTKNFGDLGKITSGVAISSQGDGTGADIRIRGVGTNRFVDAIRPSVGVFIDDVPQSRIDTAFTNLNDVERVEILKGPQSTLFGKEVSSGAIILRTRKPQLNQLEASVDLNVGNLGVRELRGVLNVPMGDMFALRLGAYSSEVDGFITNVVTNKETETSLWGGRMRLLFQPVDTLEMILTLEHHQSEADSTMIERQQYGENNLSFAAADPNVDLIPADPFDFKMQTTGAGGRVQETDNAALHITWDFADDWQLNSVTGYQKFDRDFARGDLDGGASDGAFSMFELFKFRNFADDQSLSQEFRFGYEGEKLSSLIGAFFTKVELGSDTDINLYRGDFDAFFPVKSLIERESKDWAVFTHNTYRFNENWETVVGLRYSEVRKDEKQLQQPFGGYWGTQPLPDPLPSKSDTWPALTGTLKGIYNVDDDMNVYFGYSRGFKAGGFNVAPTDPGFGEETVDALEAGFKGAFFDRRLRFNTSIFFQVYKDYQVDTPDPSGLGFIVVNAAEVRTPGVELDFTWLATDTVTVDGSLAYIDARYEDYENAPCTDAQTAATPLGENCTQDLSGEQLNGYSPWTGNLNVQYDNAFFNTGWSWYLRGEAAYRGSSIGYPDLDERTEQSAYTLFNARLGFISVGDYFQAAIWGKNLTDEKYAQSYGPGRDGLFGVQLTPGRPRTYGLNLTFRY